jgi:hypothetical protein
MAVHSLTCLRDKSRKWETDHGNEGGGGLKHERLRAVGDSQ